MPPQEGTEMSASNYRDFADMGFEDGWDAAQNEVNKLIHELYADQKPDVATTVYELVWKRLIAQQDAAMAARLAKRAARDEYAAEVAARETAQS
jgi:hypothetical protein